jgi:hypothetical protein
MEQAQIQAMQVEPAKTEAQKPAVEADSRDGRHRKTWERRLDEAKKKHRPKLKDWSKDGFATRRWADFLALREVQHTQEDVCRIRSVGVMDVREADKKAFVLQFEASYKPAIIRGIPEAEGWRAWGCWTLAQLRLRCKDRLFKVCTSTRTLVHSYSRTLVHSYIHSSTHPLVPPSLPPSLRLSLPPSLPPQPPSAVWSLHGQSQAPSAWTCCSLLEALASAYETSHPRASGPYCTERHLVLYILYLYVYTNPKTLSQIMSF